MILRNFWKIFHKNSSDIDSEFQTEKLVAEIPTIIRKSIILILFVQLIIRTARNLTKIIPKVHNALL